MPKTRVSNVSKAIVVAVGAFCLLVASSTLNFRSLNWGYLLMLGFAVAVVPRMSLTLPKSKFAISFSDTLIFLCFLLYGGKAAIILAAVENLANCLYLRSIGFPFGKWMIPTNISINTVSTSFTYLVALAVPELVGTELNPTRSQHLITILAPSGTYPVHFFVSFRCDICVPKGQFKPVQDLGPRMLFQLNDPYRWRRTRGVGLQTD